MTLPEGEECICWRRKPPDRRLVRYGSDEAARCGTTSAPAESKEGAGRMVVMISSSGIYLILALIFLVVIGGGAMVAYRRSTRQNQ